MTALSDGIKIDNGFDHQPSPVFFAIAFRCFSGCLKSAVHFSRCFFNDSKNAVRYATRRFSIWV
ncbi:hypothetical protein [Avibacterium paragallinarum]|uniref:hypothetical protein n=1 Tax=Avibacterium paragallinarum TaxID=728 RepID=UPI0003739E37|nr:hypothetical protein [Avibacterium paragallinarum]POY46131.1 hypothetical protein C3364_09150 [Avibacterium paragallinarum]RZN74830.1 hypothetical protein EC523_10915 [Avibacterium paragallinarum]